MGDDERYWSVDLPGLTEAQAASIVKVQRPGVVGATAIDPLRFLTLHLDRDSVHHLVLFARRHEPDEAVEAIVQEFEAWLRDSSE